MTDLGERVIRRLGVRGVFKIDMIKDERDGTLYVLEINARYNLWNYLGAVHGVNLPVIAYEYLAFGQVPACGTLGRPRYRWLNFYRDYKAYREQSAAGSTSFARWATSIATSRNVYEAFAWNDPEPFGWWVLDSLRKKLS